MKHADWLRLYAEAENICRMLRQRGYKCIKQSGRLSWKISTDRDSYLLTWLPAPIGDWSLLPSEPHPARNKIWLVVQKALKAGENINELLLPPIQNQYRSWTIVRLSTDLRHKTVARFFNRQDAEDQARILRRFIPSAEFEIVFDPPD
ncbi:MAG: hypothetical protein WA919_08750 [Coleofasciculaceae cyanobacterium]